MKKLLFFLCALCCATALSAQTEQSGAEKFWNNLKTLCGKAYEGTITAGGREGDGFTGNRLTMQVLSCTDNVIKVPFNVGENYSRTWVLTKESCGVLKLKHDHRNPDGSHDKVTMYGGTSTNTGSETVQFFPADQETYDLISYAATNVWWITLDENHFTYNLRKLDTDRLFTVTFDLKKPIEPQPKPWGWK
ncbi:MAG: hypothetical protein Q4G63_11160 [Bacteroidia bacterium]|nr:hypothetical protein [Bacteroidia bacterium]